MHSNKPDFPAKPMGYSDYYMQNAPRMASLFEGLVSPGITPCMPFSSVDIQPSDACPRNFIIFDQTKNRSQIMLHPEVSSKIFYPGFDVETPLFQETDEKKDGNDEKEAVSSRFKEDSDDINALLGTEYEEDEESGDEVSTARTKAIYECSSPESCSNYEPVSKRSRSLLRKSTGSHGKEKQQQRRRVREMVKVLRGVVPGANRMNTVAVLDEAVRYLKSLRVEVKKLGVGNLNK